MRLLYADSSAIIRAYFADEADHDQLRALLLEGAEAVMTSELARVELAGAVRSAHRAHRLRRPGSLLARIDADCGPDGPIALLCLEPSKVLPLAYRLVGEHPLRTLDAIHVAVAFEEAGVLAHDQEMAFVTRDQNQARAARAIGLTIT